MLATSLDDLIARGALPPPHVIKIDVDGLEPRIVSGMRTLLSSPDRPRSVQIELNTGDEATPALMAGAGYRLADTHRSSEWQRRIAAGTPDDQVPRNAIFVPRISAR